MQDPQHFPQVCSSPRWFALLFVMLGVFTSLLSIAQAGLVIRPVYVFIDGPLKSTVVTVRNDGDQPVEVTADVRYGYHVSDDTGRLVIVYPESLSSDDRSMKSWIRPYPQRFVIGPQESQGVRIFVTPPPGTPSGEYWGKMLFTPHPTKSIRQKTKGPALEVITAMEIPLHYRLSPVSTGVELDNLADAVFSNQVVQVKAHFKRIGNSSFWGRLRCRVLDHAGKSVGSLDRNLVVYKDFVVNVKIDVSATSSGPYTLEMVAETKRDDTAPKQLVHGESRRWTFPVTIQ
ncbi:MAG: molecular chaperone [Ignavibacteria bacterium]|nr:molecular chaperone [Ignavibacteria bacterium]